MNARIAFRICPIAFFLLTCAGHSSAAPATYVIGSIDRDVARSIVGTWPLFNCDVEARILSAQPGCEESCVSVAHIFVKDRIRGNSAILSLAITDAGGDASQSMLSATVLASDVYVYSPGELAYYSLSIRGFRGGISRLAIASDYLKPFQPRWHVICAP